MPEMTSFSVLAKFIHRGFNTLSDRYFGIFSKQPVPVNPTLLNIITSHFRKSDMSALFYISTVIFVVYVVYTVVTDQKRDK